MQNAECRMQNAESRSAFRILRSAFSIWLMAARTKTLAAGTAPVIIGTAMAYGDGRAHWLAAACAMLGSILIQVGTNFANDYFDHAKGTDTADRLGPLRVTQAGFVAPGTMLCATILVFLAACGPGLYIVWRGGWPFVVVGLVSILCGVLYTGGPYPLGYLGLGDLFVLIFFGPVAVVGTYYVQALDMNRDVALAGVASGLFSVAILTVNNLRDIDQDAHAGKKTLAVRFGRTFARYEYLTALMIAALVIPLALGIHTSHVSILLPILTFPAAVPTIRTVFTTTDGPALNNALAATGKLLLLFSALFAVGWIL